MFKSTVVINKNIIIEYVRCYLQKVNNKNIIIEDVALSTESK